jgi:hypothetical protein
VTQRFPSSRYCASPSIRVVAAGSTLFTLFFCPAAPPASVCPQAFLYYEGGDKPYFYFFRDLFNEAKF